MFKTHTCTSIECDHCGKALFDDDTYGMVHFADEKEAIDAEAALPVVLPGQLTIGGENR